MSTNSTLPEALSKLSQFHQLLATSSPDSDLSKHPLFQHKEDDAISLPVQLLGLVLSDFAETFIFSEFEGVFQDHLTHMLYSNENITELIESGAFEINDKAICGKQLDEPGIYFRCLDCEKVHQVQSALCPECFDQSNHEGHRVCIINLVDGLSATCDCGDDAVIKQEGLCPKHITEDVDVKVLIEKLPKEILQNYQLVLKKSLYCVFSLFEIYQRAEKPSMKNMIFLLATQTFNEILDFCQITVEEISPFFMTVFGYTLQDNLLSGFDLFWHNCEDLFADENPRLVNVEHACTCQCSLLSNFFRIGNVLGKPEQARLEKQLLESSTVASIKENLGINYMKYLPFLLNQDYSFVEFSKDTLKVFSDLLDMCATLFLRESNVKKLVELNIPEFLLTIAKKILKDCPYIHPYMTVSIGILCRRMKHFLEPRFNSIEILVKEKTILVDLLRLLASFQRKFYYKKYIKIGMPTIEVDYNINLFGLDVEVSLYEVLEHIIAYICRLPAEEKLAYSRIFIAQWYSEFTTTEICQKQKQQDSKFSLWQSLQRVFCSFVLKYSNNSITPEAVQTFLKETISALKPSELAEKILGGTLQALGLLRYSFDVVGAMEKICWKVDKNFYTCVFEKDIVTIQTLISQVESKILLKLLAGNFFSFSDELCKFFENPESLDLSEFNYK